MVVRLLEYYYDTAKGLLTTCRVPRDKDDNGRVRPTGAGGVSWAKSCRSLCVYNNIVQYTQ